MGGGGGGSSPSSPIAPQMSSLPASPLQYLNKPSDQHPMNKKNTLSPSPVPEIVLTPSGTLNLFNFNLLNKSIKTNQTDGMRQVSNIRSS